MRIITVESAELWSLIKAYGSFQSNYKNGELWLYNKKLYYLSHLNLEFSELSELLFFESGITNI